MYRRRHHAAADASAGSWLAFGTALAAVCGVFGGDVPGRVVAWADFGEGAPSAEGVAQEQG